jgi:putative ABC transport system permease protein
VFIAAPVSFLLVDRWLENFAYRTGMQLWMYAAAAGIAFLAVLLTVSTQALRASMENPVDALKSE